MGEALKVSAEELSQAETSRSRPVQDGTEFGNEEKQGDRPEHLPQIRHVEQVPRLVFSGRDQDRESTELAQRLQETGTLVAQLLDEAEGEPKLTELVHIQTDPAPATNFEDFRSEAIRAAEGLKKEFDQLTREAREGLEKVAKSQIRSAGDIPSLIFEVDQAATKANLALEYSRKLQAIMARFIVSRDAQQAKKIKGAGFSGIDAVFKKREEYSDLKYELRRRFFGLGNLLYRGRIRSADEAYHRLDDIVDLSDDRGPDLGLKYTDAYSISGLRRDLQKAVDQKVVDFYEAQLQQSEATLASRLREINGPGAQPARSILQFTYSDMEDPLLNQYLQVLTRLEGSNRGNFSAVHNRMMDVRGRVNLASGALGELARMGSAELERLKAQHDLSEREFEVARRIVTRSKLRLLNASRHSNDRQKYNEIIGSFFAEARGRQSEADIAVLYGYNPFDASEIENHDKQLFEYFQGLTEDEVKALAAYGPPGLGEIAQIVRSHPNIRKESLIENPEATEFRARLFEDDEFMAGLFLNTFNENQDVPYKEFIIVEQVRGGLDSGTPGRMQISIDEATKAGLGNLNPGMIIAENAAGFQGLCAHLARKPRGLFDEDLSETAHIKTSDKLSSGEGPYLDFAQGVTGRTDIALSRDEIERYAQKYSLDPNVVSQWMIENPVYTEWQNAKTAFALDLAGRVTPEEANLALSMPFRSAFTYGEEASKRWALAENFLSTCDNENIQRIAFGRFFSDMDGDGAKAVLSSYFENLPKFTKAAQAIARERSSELVAYTLNVFGEEWQKYSSEIGSLLGLDKQEAEFLVQAIKDLSPAVEDQSNHIDPQTVQSVKTYLETGDSRKVFIKLSELARDLDPVSRSFLWQDNIVSFVGANPEKATDVVHLAGLELMKDPKKRHFCTTHFEAIVSHPPEKAGEYIKVMEKVADSPSQEIQRMASELIGEIMRSDNPSEAFDAIESVFVRNNLPTVGKVFKIFQILHPKSVMDQTMQTVASKALTEAGPRRKEFIIFQDLLRIHILSGNRSLRDYLEVMSSGQEVLDRFEAGAQLPPDETARLGVFLNRADTLFENSLLGERARIRGEETSSRHIPDIQTRVAAIRRSIGARDGQSITDRVSEMFLRPIGLKSFGEALDIMRQAKVEAQTRGAEMVAQAQAGRLTIEAGDYLKGVNPDFIDKILQNGSVANEFLGAGFKQADATPLDTDVARINEGMAADGFGAALVRSISRDYGNITFVLRDMSTSDSGSAVGRCGWQPEVFQINEQNSEHHGIRTGFPTTEISFIVAKEGFTGDKKRLEGLFTEIAKNGWYIPVTDQTGQIIFYPHDYQRYRKAFEGISRFDGDQIQIREPQPDDPLYTELQAARQEVVVSGEKTRQIQESVIGVIEGVLAKHGVALKQKFDQSIRGTEIVATGSSDRMTNVPGEGTDYDIAVSFDVEEFTKAQAINDDLEAAFAGGHSRKFTDPEDGHTQGQFYDVSVGADRVHKIDVGMYKKSDLIYFATQEAVADRLGWVRANLGEERFLDAVSNIVLAKKTLKARGLYNKKSEDGFGGVGVENWILQNNGSFVEALRTFAVAATEGGRTLSLEEFRGRYMVLDPGINLQSLKHDNFVNNLSEASYQKMAALASDVLSAQPAGRLEVEAAG